MGCVDAGIDNREAVLRTLYRKLSSRLNQVETMVNQTFSVLSAIVMASITMLGPSRALKYFERCGKFWKMGAEQLTAWSDAVNKGQTPEFGANLNY